MHSLCTKMYRMLQKHYWWIGMKHEIEFFFLQMFGVSASQGRMNKKYTKNTLLNPLPIPFGNGKMWQWIL